MVRGGQQIEMWRQSMRLLAGADAALGADLDRGEASRRMAGFVVGEFADICAVDVTDEHGVVQRRYVAWRNGIARPAGDGGRPVETLEPGGEARVAEAVMRSGAPMLVPAIDGEHADGLDEPARRWYEGIGAASLMIVPVQANGTTCGAMHFVSIDGDRYDAAALWVAEGLGRRLGLAFEFERLGRNAEEHANEARRAHDAKDDFLGMVSHELRTPTTVIHGAARALRVRGDRLGHDERTALLRDIEIESERLHRVIENLLTLSRMRDGELLPETEPLLLQRILRRVAATVRRYRSEREVIVDAADDFPPAAGHANYVEHVLRNLLSNALKYSDPSTPVEFRLLRGKAGAAVVEVADRGAGIAPGEAERVFERFYSAGKSQSPGGAGLGLTVCKQLVQSMSGTIELEPRQGGGTIARFTLPLHERTDP